MLLVLEQRSSARQDWKDAKARAGADHLLRSWSIILTLVSGPEAKWAM